MRNTVVLATSAPIMFIRLFFCFVKSALRARLMGLVSVLQQVHLANHEEQ